MQARIQSRLFAGIQIAVKDFLQGVEDAVKFGARVLFGVAADLQIKQHDQQEDRVNDGGGRVPLPNWGKPVRVR
jgi:hypothetical protein